MIDYKEIGTNIRVERVKKGMRQYVLAELVHTSTQHMSNVECGVARISLPLLIDIANVLGTSVDALLGINQVTNRRKILEAQFGAITENVSDTIVELCVTLCKCLVEWYCRNDDKRNV